MNKHNLVNSQVTFYIRTAKKLGFIQKSKKSVLTQKELKQIAQKKSKIPAQNQILYYNGQQVKQNKNIQITDKSIVHVLDSRNIGKSKMKLLIKRLPQNSPTEDFEVDSNTSIDDFIQKQLSPFYQEPAEKLFFVYSGRELKRQKSFSQQHVESQTQLICVHQERDRKKKKTIPSARSSANSLKTKDTAQTKFQQTPKKQKLIDQEKQQTKEINKEQIKSEQYNKKTQEVIHYQQKSEQKIQIANYKQEKGNLIDEKNIEEKQQKSQKKIIKSIDEIQRDQIQSDEDSDNQANEAQVQIYPKKLPEDFLMEQTRPRSHTKSSNNNNSECSSISEPNFKKKNKASQVQAIHSFVQKRQDQNSPTSINLEKNRSQGSPQYLDKFDEQRDEITKVETKEQTIKNRKQAENNYKTREQIFEMNNHTYSSVIDEPQDYSSNANFNNVNRNAVGDREEFFNPFRNTQQQEVFDSQMNYNQVDSSKLEVKYNKGFMNFSNASFLQPSRVEAFYNQQQSHQLHLAPSSNVGSGIDDVHLISRINNRAPEFLESQIQNQQTESQKFRKQSHQQIGGDSLSFSKQQSEVKGAQQNEDNLFIEYRRGQAAQQKNKKILIQEDEISESNLLSDTYHNPNATEIMNSITFNLEPNPDEMISYLQQSQIHIVPEQQIEEQQNAMVYEKRESEIQTNFRDSANPSQICSTSSQINANMQGNANEGAESNFGIEPMSLIENLISMMDYKINVNSVQSEQSDDQQSDDKRNFVAIESDISANEQMQTQPLSNEIQIPLSKLNLQEQSNVFVQYQSYRADIQSEVNDFNKQKYEPSIQYQSNLLQENSFGITQQRSLQSNFYKKTIGIQSNIDNNNLYQNQNSAIKIIQEESIAQDQIRISQTNENNVSGTFMNNQESPNNSAAFHQITQSVNEKIQQSSNLFNNGDNDPYEITFRKEIRQSQSKIDDPQYQSRIDQPQGSKLLYQLSLQALNQTQQPQLLPGDYIYSTDKVQTPDEALQSILKNFTHCF